MCCLCVYMFFNVLLHQQQTTLLFCPIINLGFSLHNDSKSWSTCASTASRPLYMVPHSLRFRNGMAVASKQQKIPRYFWYVWKIYEHLLTDVSLGFAAGVMVAASFWSLLAPAIEISEASMGSWAFLPVAVG